MERLTTVIKVMGEEKVYYAKGLGRPTTLCAEMETWEIRECMRELAHYEDMHEKVIERIKKMKAMDNYPSALVEQEVKVLEWVLDLLDRRLELKSDSISREAVLSYIDAHQEELSQEHPAQLALAEIECFVKEMPNV